MLDAKVNALLEQIACVMKQMRSGEPFDPALIMRARALQDAARVMETQDLRGSAWAADVRRARQALIEREHGYFTLNIV